MIVPMPTRIRVSATVSLLLGMVFVQIAAADEFWSLTNYKDENSGEAIVALRQESSDSIPDVSGKEEIEPLLEFRCVAGGGEAIQFRVNWRRFISSFNTEVGFRADGGKTMWLKLGVDASNEITFSSSTADVEKLIEKFSAGEIMELDIAPYSEAAVLVHFNISTFESALESLKQSCH